MAFADALTDLRSKALDGGAFDLGCTDSLSQAINTARVPSCAGVYVITAPCDAEAVLYVGRSGTVHQDGSLGDQGIAERLRKRQGGLSREQFFRRVMHDRAIDALHFEWFETYRRHEGTPPFLWEALLLAAHLDEHGCLPALNESA